MIRSIQAELVKLTRPRFVAITVVVTIVFAAALSAVGVLTAESGSTGGPAGPGSLLSIESLGDAGGGTAVFAQTAAFGAVFLLAVFIATVAGELTGGRSARCSCSSRAGAGCSPARSSPWSASRRCSPCWPRPSPG